MTRTTDLRFIHRIHQIHKAFRRSFEMKIPMLQQVAVMTESTPSAEKRKPVVSFSNLFETIVLAVCSVIVLFRVSETRRTAFRDRKLAKTWVQDSRMVQVTYSISDSSNHSGLFKAVPLWPFSTTMQISDTNQNVIRAQSTRRVPIAFQEKTVAVP